MDELVTLARADGPYGEVVLRRRFGGDSHGDSAPDEFVDELIVNGSFAMDSAETSSERALGRLPFPFSGARVLLGGLGLGYTANELLDADVATLEIVEIEPALVAWARQRLTVGLGRIADDPRVRLTVADIATVLVRADGATWDAIMLDVDNGPDFLIHQQNAGLYSSRGLRSAYERLSPSGLLAIWCQGPSPALLATLNALGPSPGRYRHRVRRGEREWSYAIYTVQRTSVP
jgi:spermidine synthase